MFYNIFKKTQQKEKIENKPKIIVDIHEKNSMVPCYLAEKSDIEFKSLKVGDYIIGKIVIERKTFRDFVSSMISRRLIDQINHLQKTKFPLIIIEGQKDIEDFSNFNLNSVRGLILSILTKQNIPIIFTEDSQETATYLWLLAKQQIKNSNEISFHSRIPKTKEQRKKYVLESFPSIGPKTAGKLLEKFKTLGKIFNAPEEELKPILKSKTEDFKRLINEN